MQEIIRIQLTEVVGSPLCVASDDGQKVFEQIARALSNDYPVQISFLNVVSLTSAFLNTAIGQLYGVFPNDTLKDRLTVSEIDPTDARLLKRVIETAKLYFSDPTIIENARKHVLGESNDEEYHA